MTLKIKLLVSFLLLMVDIFFGQMQQYNYKRELINVRDTWHKIVLPDDVFEKVSPDLSDIRVFGITQKHDTIEASYLLQLKSEKQIINTVGFKIINTSYNEKGYYFTLEVPSQKTINQLLLDFKQFNFDWMVSLEGSQNQKEWFTILDDYRLLSIKNAQTFYQYTNMVFPSSNYRFFRILIKSHEKPELKSVKATETYTENGLYHDAVMKTLTIQENSKEKNTEIAIELLKTVPISYIKFDVHATYDYYRNVIMEYVSDSIKTENGYVYDYRTLTKGILNSIENNAFKFENTIAKKLRIRIDNQDNQPLQFDHITIKGNSYELAVRFTEPATYFLIYGNILAHSPSYDLERFTSKTPDTIYGITLGKEQAIPKMQPSKTSLFENKLWLWGILLLTIVILGWFSLKMIKTN